MISLVVDVSTVQVRSLSDRERAGVRGYGFSEVRSPSPGALRTTLCVAVERRPLPDGER
jgi:hypothetical protein